MKLRALAKRLFAAAMLLLILAMLGIATISFGHQRFPPSLEVVNGRVPGTSAGAGELRAGAARVELAVPAHGPIAGYPPWRRDDGSGEPVFVRALVLEQGELNAVLVSLPLLMVPGPLEAEILERAQLNPQSCLLIAATHTHSGPGGTWDNLLLEVGGNGLYRRARADAVAQAVADAIALARSRLAPAHVAAALENWTAGPAQARSGTIDQALGAARVLDNDGRPLASLLVYGMHATVIPRSAHGISGDWPEAAARSLEKASDGAPALIFQGAGGNATWLRANLPADPGQAADALGARVAGEASRLISAAAISPAAAPLSCSTRLFALPEPRAGNSMFKPIRRAAGNLLRLYADRAVVESAIELPGLTLQGIPGEPSGELGLLARRARGPQTMLVGLADGYASYIETAAKWQSGAGESLRSWYGPDLAQVLGLEPPRPLLNQSQ